MDGPITEVPHANPIWCWQVSHAFLPPRLQRNWYGIDFHMLRKLHGTPFWVLWNHWSHINFIHSIMNNNSNWIRWRVWVIWSITHVFVQTQESIMSRYYGVGGWNLLFFMWTVFHFFCILQFPFSLPTHPIFSFRRIPNTLIVEI